MRPSEIYKQNISAIKSIVEKHKGMNPRVFGSSSRDEDNENSDLDLLIDASDGMSLLDLADIQVELEEILGISVDVMTPGFISEEFREKVVRESITI